MGRIVLPISAEGLLAALKALGMKTPEDFKITSVEFDHVRNMAMVYCESKEYPEPPEGGECRTKTLIYSVPITGGLKLELE